MSVRAVGDRIEELLAGLRASREKAAAEELVSLLVEMYGDGLGRIASTVDSETLTKLADDDLVASLLLLHDLHPLDTDTRIQRALDKVRPYLGSHAGGVTYLGVDEQGVAHLRLEGSCDGCASSTVTVQSAIEGAIKDAAPEVTAIDVQGVVTQDKPLLQVEMGAPEGWHSAEPASEAAWSALPDIGPPTGRPVTVELDGTRVLVCTIRGELYAYRDACARCGSSLAEASVNGNVLTCPSCAARFNARIAGRGLDSPALHLDPLPLLSDSHGVRVAVPT